MMKKSRRKPSRSSQSETPLMRISARRRVRLSGARLRGVPAGGHCPLHEDVARAARVGGARHRSTSTAALTGPGEVSWAEFW
jgi:hypothetical protein